MSSRGLFGIYKGRLRLVASGAVAIVGLLVGFASPALALTRTDANQDFYEGNGHNESSRWTDSTPDYADSRVTVNVGCNRDFTVTIREDRDWEPDPDRGHEWVNCTSYSEIDQPLTWRCLFHSSHDFGALKSMCWYTAIGVRERSKSIMSPSRRQQARY